MIAINERLAEMSHEEILKYARILGDASRGSITVDDDFKLACQLGQYFLQSMVDDEGEVDSVVEELQAGSRPKKVRR